MKITGIETFICDCYRTNWVFVKVLTDEGLYGWGEATLEMRELTVAQAVKELEPGLLGKNPMDIEDFWFHAYRDAYWRGGPVLMSAMAGVDMALWDIMGKALDVPVHRLLGGKVREAVPCYLNGWFAPAKTAEEFADKAAALVYSGFWGLKWDPFGDAWLTLSPKEFDRAMDCVAQVKAAVKGKLDLIIEGHGRFDIPTAFRIAKQLEKYDVLWFEEPIPPDNPRGLAQLRNRVGVCLAAGERLYNRYDYRDFFRLGCADYIQPDVCHAGGISELRKIANMAEVHHIPFCPHNPNGPVAHAATLQVAAATPNFFLLETMLDDVPHRAEICDERLCLQNGKTLVPDRPGLGIELDEAAIKKYPYKIHPLRHYGGDLTDIRPKQTEHYFKS
jgi:galactonate dehydratase